jgi:hypothetical protein
MFVVAAGYGLRFGPLKRCGCRKPNPAKTRISLRLSGLRFLRIGGYWYPRGGIPIDVFWQTGRVPKGLWLPEQGVAPYRGRG